LRSMAHSFRRIEWCKSMRRAPTGFNAGDSVELPAIRFLWAIGTGPDGGGAHRSKESEPTISPKISDPLQCCHRPRCKLFRLAYNECATISVGPPSTMSRLCGNGYHCRIRGLVEELHGSVLSSPRPQGE
jgi:hypothetical protein